MELDQAQSIDTPEAPKELDPQSARRMEIAERMEARRMQEIADGPQGILLEPDPPPEPQHAEPDPSESASPPIEPAPRQVERDPVAVPVVAAPVAPPQPQLFPLQLPNGQITYVTPEQMAYLAQRGAMADMQPPAAPVAPEPPPKPATHAAVFDGEKARDVVRRIAYGGEDDGALALQEFIQSAIPQYDVDAIRQQTKDELRAEQQLERNLNALGQEFPDIFGDQIRTFAAVAELDRIRRDPLAQQFPDIELQREACARVRRSLGSAAPQPQPMEPVSTPVLQAAPAVAASAARLERKRGAPSMPTAADRRMGMTDDAPRAPTPREVINQMRVKRGQPPLE